MKVDMCGHATLATAHVPFSTGAADAVVRFTARCGILTARPAGNGAYTMDFPVAPLAAVPAPDGLAAALGAEPLSVHHAGPYKDDLLVELPDEKAVRSLAPDSAAPAALSGRAVIATAPADDPDGGHQFVSRSSHPPSASPRPR